MYAYIHVCMYAYILVHSSTTVPAVVSFYLSNNYQIMALSATSPATGGNDSNDARPPDADFDLMPIAAELAADIMHARDLEEQLGRCHEQQACQEKHEASWKFIRAELELRAAHNAMQK